MLQRWRKDKDLYADVERKFVSDSERAVRPHVTKKRSSPRRRTRGHFLFARTIRNHSNWQSRWMMLSGGLLQHQRRSVSSFLFQGKLINHFCHQRSPSRLVAGAGAGSGVAIKVFIERYVVTPVRV
jgi:hypothetical protein